MGPTAGTPAIFSAAADALQLSVVIVGVQVDYRDNHQLFEIIRGDSIH
jgi:hypothetical protein